MYKWIQQIKSLHKAHPLMEQKEIWLDVEKTRRELLITYSDNEDMDR